MEINQKEKKNKCIFRRAEEPRKKNIIHVVKMLAQSTTTVVDIRFQCRSPAGEKKTKLKTQSLFFEFPAVNGMHFFFRRTRPRRPKKGINLSIPVLSR